VKNKLQTFYRQVASCRTCYGQKEGTLVPPGAPAPDGTPVLVLGEQPDREHCLAPASNGSGVPDSGRKAVAEFLAAAGVDPTLVMYATVVQCVPQNEALRPGRPTPTEARNCVRHLKELISLVRPRVIVPLGHTSLQSLQMLYDDWTELRRYILNYDVGNVLERKGLAVYPLYHPSPTTLKARPKIRQVRDWQRIPAILDSLARSRAAR